MAVEMTIPFKCDPEVAFECAKNTLLNFGVGRPKCYANKKFLCLARQFNFHLPFEARIFSETKTLSIQIVPLNDNNINITLLAAYPGGEAINDGDIILLLHAFLEAFSTNLEQAGW